MPDDVVRQSPRAVKSWCAFLRAINVGGRIVKMERLRAEFEALGLEAVETFIASGNVIFQTRAISEETLRVKIESHLASALGYEVATFLRPIAELSRIAREQPFAENLAAGHSRLVVLLQAAPTLLAAKNLIASAGETDEFQVHHREIYWLCRTRLSDSKFTGARLEKLLGARSTVRNLTTINRLAAKYG